MATMPNVVGMSWEQATVALIQAGVVPNNGQLPGSAYPTLGYFDIWPIALAWVKSSTAKPGTVTAQLPASSTTVPFDSSVTLTVSNYPMAVADQFSAGGYT